MPVKRSPKGSGRSVASPSGIRFEGDLALEIERLVTVEGRSRNDVVNRLVRAGLASANPGGARDALYEDLWGRIDELNTALGDATDDLTDRVNRLSWIVKRELKPEVVKGVRAPWPNVVAMPAKGERASIESNVDEPQDLHESEIEVVHYAAAGSGGHPEPTPTGETVLVINPIARIAIRNKWKAVKVVGDSMEPDYHEGDFVILQPVNGDTSLLKQEDTCYVYYEGELLLKRIHFKREHDGRLSNVQLESINKKRKTISVDPDDDFVVIGREEYHVKVRGRFR